MYKYEHIAKFYDLFSPASNADKKFYLEESKKYKGKVLEVAVGTGRIFLPLLQNGIDAYGFDISKTMIEVLKEKAKKKKIDLTGRISHHDMRKFRLNKKFDLIIIPYRAFLHNLTPDNQVATLKQCYKHLKKGGKLILNFFLVNPFSMVKRLSGPAKESDITIKKKNYSVRIIAHVYHDYPKQLIHVKNTFKEKIKGKPIKTYKDEYKLAWIGVNEFKHMTARAGFKIEKLYGDFKRNPLKMKKKNELIWILKK